MNNQVVVSEDDQAQVKPLRKEDLPEWKAFAHLANNGIGIAEAARKYNIPTTTLFQWVQKKLIARIGKDGQKVLLNEQDVAYCWKIYQRAGIRGRKLFNSDGTPYTPKTGPLAPQKNGSNNHLYKNLSNSIDKS